MKILRLDLRPFGPFSDVTLNLEAGDYGLHLIYGPNEAGKSATLRALRQFFYGIEERTTDAFRHPYDKLRVAGRVRHSDGTVLECIRRKARVNPLRGPDDKAILDETKDLARLLGGLNEESFRTVFGIDHEELKAGAQNIVKSDGHLGEVLFASASGSRIGDLRAIQEVLQTETSNLFRPAGRTQRINKALSDLRETQVTMKRQQLSAEEWARHDRDLQAAEQEKQRVESERQKKRRELNRLKRIGDALPAIARRKELLAGWAEHGDTILLPPDFSEKRQKAQETLRVAEDQAHQAELALEQIDEELHKLDVPEALLAQGEGIEDLHQRLGEYQKGMKDRPVRVIQAKNLEHDAKEILRSLRRPAELDQTEDLRLSVDEPLKVQNLGTQQQGLNTRCDTARQARDELVRRIEQAKQKLAGLAAPLDPAELRRLIRAIQKEGPLEDQLAAEQHKISHAEKQAAIQLSRLTLWSGSQEALEKLPIPAAETLDRFESDLNKLEGTRAQLDERARELEVDVRALDGQIERLEHEQDVPSEGDLQQARQLRDSGWRLVRQAWLEQSALGLEVTDFVAKFAPAGNLAEAYGWSVERADLIADRLRREANRVATKAKLVADRGQRRDQLERLHDQLRETRDRLTQVEGQWADLWQMLNVHPLSPREMRAWLNKQGELVREVKLLREQREQAARLQERIQTQRSQLSSRLQKLGEPGPDHDETLVSVLEQSQDVVDRFDRVKRDREGLEREIAGHTQDLPGAEARARQSEAELTRWQEQWAVAMARLGLEANAAPAQANAVLAAITTFFQKHHEADGFRRRIDGIDRDAAAYRDDVKKMVQRTASDLASLEVEAAEKELYSRLQRARAAKQSWENLLKQRKQEAGRLDKAQETLAATRSRLADMCQHADCENYDELPRVERRSARRQQIEHDIRQNEEHLLTLSAGATLDEFIADAALIDADNIGPEIQVLAKQIGDEEIAISRLDQTIGSERALLAAMHDNAAASEAAERAQNLLAQLQTDVEQYVALRVAATVLKKAIERYRTKNQGAVLARASQLFADLTVGSFESLQITYDDGGQAVLIGVRSGDREEVGVTGMSDGSCDQLYLALRLASLETYLAAHEPIPFIVDDILLNFDNDRALAALKALAQLSRHTQVIFFTHHEHLVELGRKHLAKDVLFTHHLPDRALWKSGQQETQVGGQATSGLAATV